MMDWFDLVLLGVAAFFIVRVLWRYRRIKKQMAEIDPEGNAGSIKGRDIIETSNGALYEPNSLDQYRKKETGELWEVGVTGISSHDRKSTFGGFVMLTPEGKDGPEVEVSDDELARDYELVKLRQDGDVRGRNK